MRAETKIMNKTENIAKELESIKMLLVLLLVKLGSDSKEIAMALGIDSSSVRHLMPIRKIKKIIIPEEK